MPTQKFEATPTLKNGTLEWKLCHTSPGPTKCGETKATYPYVDLGQNSGVHKFEFEITNDQTGLGIKFANDPLWIALGTQPTGPAVDAQIENVCVADGGTELKFDDKNTKPNLNDPAAVVLKYQLNFVDKDGKKVTAIDPDIKNGGTNFFGELNLLSLAISAGVIATLLSALIFFFVGRWHHRKFG